MAIHQPALKEMSIENEAAIHSTKALFTMHLADSLLSVE